MKILLYGLTEKGKKALGDEFLEFKRMTREEKQQFDKLFRVLVDKSRGWISLQGMPITDYVNPLKIKMEIVKALAKEDCKEGLDYKVVIE